MLNDQEIQALDPFLTIDTNLSVLRWLNFCIINLVISWKTVISLTLRIGKQVKTNFDRIQSWEQFDSSPGRFFRLKDLEFDCKWSLK